jgi:hypothetical protein
VPVEIHTRVGARAEVGRAGQDPTAELAELTDTAVDDGDHRLGIALCRTPGALEAELSCAPPLCPERVGRGDAGVRRHEGVDFDAGGACGPKVVDGGAKRVGRQGDGVESVALERHGDGRLERREGIGSDPLDDESDRFVSGEAGGERGGGVGEIGGRSGGGRRCRRGDRGGRGGEGAGCGVGRCREFGRWCGRCGTGIGWGGRLGGGEGDRRQGDDGGCGQHGECRTAEVALALWCCRAHSGSGRRGTV